MTSGRPASRRALQTRVIRSVIARTPVRPVLSPSRVQVEHSCKSRTPAPKWRQFPPGPGRGHGADGFVSLRGLDLVHDLVSAGRLVRSNVVRTLAWTMHGLIVLVMIGRVSCID